MREGLSQCLCGEEITRPQVVMHTDARTYKIEGSVCGWEVVYMYPIYIYIYLTQVFRH